MEETTLPNPGTLESILCEKYPKDFKYDDFRNEKKEQLGNKIKEKMAEAILSSIKNEFGQIVEISHLHLYHKQLN